MVFAPPENGYFPRRLFRSGLFLLLPALFVFSCDPSGSAKAKYGAVSDFGKACASGSQCQSLRCIEMNEIMACTRYCEKANDCPLGFYCALEEPERNPPLGLCRPLDANAVCKRCSNDTQCNLIGGTCLPTGRSTYCLMPCGLSPCPEGFTCTPFDEVAGDFCTPNTDECECNTLKEGARRSCSNENEFGLCSGAMTCMGAAGWTNCDAAVPGPEVCDGIDNNCDGQIDEGILGTVNHCSECGHVCQGGGFPGTMPVCENYQCGLSCAANYYDSNTNPQDGCECMDDTYGAKSASTAISMGNFTSCDFRHQITDSRVPADLDRTASPDYFRFAYQNVWNCVQELEVHLRIPSSAAPHTLCVSSANNTNEATWTCRVVTPSSTVKISPYNNGGSYYIKVALQNEGQPNCSNYLLTICDGNCP